MIPMISQITRRTEPSRMLASTFLCCLASGGVMGVGKSGERGGEPRRLAALGEQRGEVVPAGGQARTAGALGHPVIDVRGDRRPGVSHLAQVAAGADRAGAVAEHLGGAFVVALAVAAAERVHPV